MFTLNMDEKHAVHKKISDHGSETHWNLEKRENIFQSGKSQGIWSKVEKSVNFTQNIGKVRDFFIFIFIFIFFK